MTDMMKTLDIFTNQVLGHIWTELVDDCQIASKNAIIIKKQTEQQNELGISLAIKYYNQQLIID